MNSSKEVIELIMKLADEKKITLSKLAEKVGMAKSSLSRYKSGERDFPINEVGKFASVLGVSVEYLLGLKESSGLKHSYHYLPTSISAGLPLDVEAVTESETIQVPDSIMGKWAGDPNIFFSKINGDSMDEIIPDGSLIAIKPIEKEALKDGDIVVFSDSHEYSVKYFYKTPDKLIFKPASYNRQHHEQHFALDDGVNIHGKVVLYIVELD